jgi:predicted NBD/HSP70 family sugar kinase
MKHVGETAIGIDFGGTKIEVALADVDGVLLERERLETRAELGPRQALERAAAAVRRMEALARETHSASVTGYAAVAPGIVQRDRILLTPNLPGWEDLSLASELQALLNLDSAPAVANDVRGGALAELRFGALRGIDPGLYISLGTGIAAAVTVGGTVVMGFNQAAGEIAYVDPGLGSDPAESTTASHARHEPADSDADSDDSQGLRSAEPGVRESHRPGATSLEEIVGVSGDLDSDDSRKLGRAEPGVRESHRPGAAPREEIVGGSADSSSDSDDSRGLGGAEPGVRGSHRPGAAPLEEFVGGKAIGERASARLGRAITAAEIFARAAADPADEIARSVVSETLDVLARAIANIATLIDPELIVLGGGMMGSAGVILPGLRERFAADASYLPFPPRLAAAHFTRDASLHGAVALALEHSHNHGGGHAALCSRPLGVVRIPAVSGPGTTNPVEGSQLTTGGSSS